MVINRSNKATQVHLRAQRKLHIPWCSGDLIFLSDFSQPIPCPCLRSSSSVSCSLIVKSNWTCLMSQFSQKTSKSTFIKVLDNIDLKNSFVKIGLYFEVVFCSFREGMSTLVREEDSSLFPVSLVCKKRAKVRS